MGELSLLQHRVQHHSTTQPTCTTPALNTAQHFYLQIVWPVFDVMAFSVGRRDCDFGDENITGVSGLFLLLFVCFFIECR
jgi:hypothetical protein